MKDIIRLLPDSVADQIAAGEVIQRPASVIKELVENSLDAGATKIQVVVADGGRTSIQVVDNGRGMSATDARLSFKKHATSKIRDAQDIYALSTMGFRGEALASIAAVAEVELRTRLADEQLGTCLTLKKAEVVSQEEVMCPVGANFIVRDLFWNMPARRSHMDSVRKDQAHNLVEFERVALAHPDIHFTLATPEAVLIDLPTGSFRQRVINLFGRGLDKHLLGVKVDTSAVRIDGFVGSPESSKKRGVKQFLFVNGRYMRHPGFAKAVLSAYERLIPDTDQVPFFIQLEVDPSRIDVNIHPQKTEIRFLDEQTIWPILRAAVRESLGRFHATPTIDFDTENRPEIDVFRGDIRDVPIPTITIDPNYNPFDSVPADTNSSEGHTKVSAPPHHTHTTRHNSTSPLTPPPGTRADITMHDSAMSDTTGFPPPPPVVTPDLPPFSWTDAPMSQVSRQQDGSLENLSTLAHSTEAAPALARPEVSETPAEQELPLTGGAPFIVENADFLEYKGRYLITPCERGLWVIDFHRAHTRVLYEELLEHARERAVESQGLLFGHRLDVSPAQAFMVETMLDELHSLGFTIERSQDGAYDIVAVPALIGGIDPARLLLALIDDAADRRTDAKEEILHSATLQLARRAAIPVGQVLTPEEMRELVTRLFATSAPSLTPDGRTILTLIPHDLVVQKF